MPSRTRRFLCPGRLLVAALAVGGTACPTGFVDPEPPVLRRLDYNWTPPVEDLPTVYALLLDLHLASGLDCDTIKSRFIAQARAVLLPSGATGVELPVMDISPTCRQSQDRHLDLDALDAAIRGAETTYGQGRVRPILVYVNNVDLPVPLGLQSDFAGLRILASGRGSHLPLLWCVAAGRAQDVTLFERRVAWTHSEDPGLFGGAGLGAVALQELPLRALGSVPGGVPLYDPAKMAGAVEYKACAPGDPLIVPVGFAFDGRSRPVNLTRPPRFRFEPPPAPPAMRTSFITPIVQVKLEACSSRCDRFWRLPDGALLAWNRAGSCLMTAGGAAP